MKENGSGKEVKKVKDYEKEYKESVRRDENLNFRLGSIFKPPACSIN